MAIYISQDLVLSEIVEAPVNPNNPLIGYHTILTTTGVAVSSEAFPYLGVNLANPRTDLYWQAGDTADQTITITNTDVVPLDYVGIARHNSLEAQNTIEIEGYTAVDEFDDPIWEVLIAEHMPASNDPLLYRFAKEIYLGIRIHFKANVVAPLAAVVYCGELLTLIRRIYVGHPPMTLNRKTRTQTGRSENGNFLGRVILSETMETNVSMKNVPPLWYREYMVPFVTVSQEQPFFWAWRPSTYPAEVGFAWLTADLTVDNQRPNGMMQFAMAMQGIGSIA